MPSAGVLKAGKAVIEFVLSDKNVVKGLDNIQLRAEKVGQAFKGMATKLGAASSIVLSVIGGATAKFISLGDALSDMATRTGFSVKRLSELKFAAEQSGASLDDLARGVKGMEAFILGASRGGDGAADVLKDLGLSFDDLKGKAPEAQFETLAEAISKVKDPTLRAALSAKVFGKAGGALLPLLADGVEGFKKFAAAADKAGATMTEKDAKAASELDDIIQRLKSQFTGLAVQIGGAVADSLAGFGNRASEILATTIGWLRENRELVSSVGGLAVKLAGVSAVIGTVGFVLGPTIGLLRMVPAAITGIRIAATALYANPVLAGLGLLATGVLSAATYFALLEDNAEGAAAAVGDFGGGKSGGGGASGGWDASPTPKVSTSGGFGMLGGARSAIESGGSAAMAAAGAGLGQLIHGAAIAAAKAQIDAVAEGKKLDDEIAHAKIDAIEDEDERRKALIEYERQQAVKELQLGGLVTPENLARIDALAQARNAAGKPKDEATSLAVLDATFADRQFGQSDTTRRQLDKLIENTDPRKQKTAGPIPVI
jgi:hypothetical protein